MAQDLWQLWHAVCQLSIQLNIFYFFLGLVTPAEGLVTPSGIASIPAGMETPEAIELRKKRIESEMER